MIGRTNKKKTKVKIILKKKDIRVLKNKYHLFHNSLYQM